MRRVLSPFGSFHFVEYGHAPDPKVARWQERTEPRYTALTRGCHLTRRIPDRIRDAGFAIDQLETSYMKGEPKPFAYTFEGRATPM